ALGLSLSTGRTGTHPGTPALTTGGSSPSRPIGARWRRSTAQADLDLGADLTTLAQVPRIQADTGCCRHSRDGNAHLSDVRNGAREPPPLRHATRTSGVKSTPTT